MLTNEYNPSATPNSLGRSNKQANEQQLLRELLSVLAQANQRGVCISRLVDGRILQVNESFIQLTGYSRAELVGQSIYKGSFWIDPTRQYQLIALLRSGGRVRGVEFKFQHKTGQLLDVAVSIELVVIGGQTCMVSYTDDSSAHKPTKQSEAPAQIGDQLYRDLMEQSSDGIVLSDDNGRNIEANPAACQILGYAREELLDINLGDIASGENIAHLKANNEALSVGRIVRAEIFLRRRDGQLIPVDYSAKLTADGLRQLMFRDISERQRAKEESRSRAAAEQANLSKSRFLARMSHELRTPLNAIIGFTQLLEMDELSAEQRESVDYINTAGHHLLSLINDVLDIARVESGRMNLCLKPIMIDGVVAQTVDLVQPLADNRNLKIDTAYQELEDIQVIADEQRLKQALINLLSNAIKYSYEGGQISIASERSENRFRLLVSDSGPGISADKLDSIFNPFERLDAEETPIEGTGLGLTITKEMVEGMGGTVGVSSTLGQGSTFWIELPLEVVETRAHAVTDIQQHTVLYLEDHQNSVALVKSILDQRPDVNLLTSPDGLCVEIAAKQPIDLIILDLNLPDMSGEEVLNKIAADERLRHIPVVITSANAIPAVVDRLLAAGVAGYIPKPLDAGCVLETLERLLPRE